MVIWVKNKIAQKAKAVPFRKTLAGRSQEELLGCFRSEQWAHLKRNDRLAVAQELENRNAAEQGRAPCTVKDLKAKGKYGCYDSQSNTIWINPRDVVYSEKGVRMRNSGYQVLDCVYHEGEHAHQENCVKNNIGPPQGLPQTTRDMCEVENARITRRNAALGSGRRYTEEQYTKNPFTGKERVKTVQKRFAAGDFYNYKRTIDYESCTCEIDSNTAAAKKLMEHRALFEGDPAYGEYIREAERRFAGFPQEGPALYMQQSNAVQECFEREEFDRGRMEDILLNEIGVGKEQPAFAEARAVGAQLGQLRREMAAERQVSNEARAEQKVSNETRAERRASGEEQAAERRAAPNGERAANEEQAASEELSEAEEEEYTVRRR